MDHGWRWWVGGNPNGHRNNLGNGTESVFHSQFLSFQLFLNCLDSISHFELDGPFWRKSQYPRRCFDYICFFFAVGSELRYGGQLAVLFCLVISFEARFQVMLSFSHPSEWLVQYLRIGLGFLLMGEI